MRSGGDETTGAALCAYSIPGTSTPMSQRRPESVGSDHSRRGGVRFDRAALSVRKDDVANQVGLRRRFLEEIAAARHGEVRRILTQQQAPRDVEIAIFWSFRRGSSTLPVAISRSPVTAWRFCRSRHQVHSPQCDREAEREAHPPECSPAPPQAWQ